ncbi:hypothetical protein EJ08DRAFT_476265 [Tothia fuscella]|uniref:Uncharacterized protein n=1 Tax=Tothia fuscella TaxID=1048955 RepID=A0A9P4NHX2_9PEZI|nr:hypothetical protein EJ08DRAFT_476265 [Tothia fuscella]
MAADSLSVHHIGRARTLEYHKHFFSRYHQRRPSTRLSVSSSKNTCAPKTYHWHHPRETMSSKGTSGYSDQSRPDPTCEQCHGSGSYGHTYFRSVTKICWSCEATGSTTDRRERTVSCNECGRSGDHTVQEPYVVEEKCECYY